jgi:hypothetical protein
LVNILIGCKQISLTPVMHEGKHINKKIYSICLGWLATEVVKTLD